MSILSSTYYDRIIVHASASFSNLVQTGELIEDDLKTGKIKDYQAFFEKLPSGVEEANKKTFPNKKNEKGEKEVYSISSHAPRAPALLCSFGSRLSYVSTTLYTSSVP